MNDNTSLSFGAPALVILGIIALTVAPPIGIILFIWAFFVQRRFRRVFRLARAAEQQKARERAMRTRILAAKSLP